VIALYVYGLLPSWGEPVLRLAIVPGIIGSGFAMWFAAPLRGSARRTIGAGAPAEDPRAATAT
jgi:hypothetical protein